MNLDRTSGLPTASDRQKKVHGETDLQKPVCEGRFSMVYKRWPLRLRVASAPNCNLPICAMIEKLLEKRH